MKHLLNGVAIAAALAIAAPVWAQAPMTPPGAPKPAPSAPKAAAAPMAPMVPMAAGKQRHKRMMHRMAKRGGGDSATDQLNRQELARIQGGAGMAPPPMNTESTMPAKIGSPKQP